jgi:predicted PurR-regulated permease PerM
MVLSAKKSISVENMEKNSYSVISSNKNLKTIFLILFFVVLLIMGYIYKSFYWAFIFALVFYVSFKPFHDILIKYFKKRSLATMLVVLLFMFSIALPFYFLAASLVEQASLAISFVKSLKINELYAFLSEYKYFKYIESITDIGGEKLLVEGQRQLSSLLIVFIKMITASIASLGKNLFFMLLILSFMLSEGHWIGGKAYDIIPFPDDIEKDIANRLKYVIKVVVAGNMLMMILQGIMVVIAFEYFSEDFSNNISLIAGLIAAIFSLIPVVGTSVVFIPAGVYLFFVGKYVQAGVFVAWCFGWYLFLENYIKPKILGKKLKFHPLIFFFLLLGSIQSFGLPGIILGPVLLTLFLALWEIYKILDVYGVAKKKRRSAR